MHLPRLTAGGRTISSPFDKLRASSLIKGKLFARHRGLAFSLYGVPSIHSGFPRCGPSTLLRVSTDIAKFSMKITSHRARFY